MTKVYEPQLRLSLRFKLHIQNTDSKCVNIQNTDAAKGISEA